MSPTLIDGVPYHQVMRAARTDQVLLAVDDVSVAYGDKQVLKGLTVHVQDLIRPDSGTHQGQIVGLLGPSGIGKTTLFRVLSGLQQPDTGTVRIGVDGQPARPGLVGVVAQHYPLAGHRTITGNLLVAARKAGLTGDAAKVRVREMLEAFGLPDQGDKYPIELSGGQRQRVAIAQQMLCSERFVVMDEPFSGLDVKNLRQVQRLIVGLAEQHEHNTIIVVTHDVTAAVTLCDTIWLMGRDRDAEDRIIPGAHIVDKYDLVERGLCWHPQIGELPECRSLIDEIKNRIERL